ncbi:MAG: glutathione synthase [Myxococcota bacterium]|nr:glutathione synthase [Myxococcota bacterium]
MRHLFLMDPIEEIRVDLDSTFALMLEAQGRGHQVLYAQTRDLYGRDGRARAMAHEVHLTPTQGEHAHLQGSADLDLADVDAVWMRKDPPFDMDYIFATYLLDLAAENTLVVNHPEGLRSFNEKAWALQFTDLVPESLVTQSQEQLREFAEDLGSIVVKPLDGNGGAGVFIVRSDDPNIGVILEMSTDHGATKVLAQRYLPEAREGDKRIILVDGKPVGACLRVPTGVDHRGNIHVGARCERAEITSRDHEICRQIGPALKEAGQIFVGIDVIGDWLTEVNVTSPTCIHEINALDEVRIDQMILDAVMERSESR